MLVKKYIRGYFFGKITEGDNNNGFLFFLFALLKKKKEIEIHTHALFFLKEKAQKV